MVTLIRLEIDNVIEKKGIFPSSTRHLVVVQNSTSYPILVSLVEKCYTLHIETNSLVVHPAMSPYEFVNNVEPFQYDNILIEQRVCHQLQFKW